jgi:hypothetical protein
MLFVIDRGVAPWFIQYFRAHHYRNNHGTIGRGAIALLIEPQI